MPLTVLLVFYHNSYKQLRHWDVCVLPWHCPWRSSGAVSGVLYPRQPQALVGDKRASCNVKVSTDTNCIFK